MEAEVEAEAEAEAEAAAAAEAEAAAAAAADVVVTGGVCVAASNSTTAGALDAFAPVVCWLRLLVEASTPVPGVSSLSSSSLSCAAATAALV